MPRMQRLDLCEGRSGKLLYSVGVQQVEVDLESASALGIAGLEYSVVYQTRQPVPPVADSADSFTVQGQDYALLRRSLSGNLTTFAG